MQKFYFLSKKANRFNAVKQFLFFIILLLSSFAAKATSYYWVGGTGNWSEFATHWATTSGGSTFQSQVPQSTDNVYFDANSFSSTGQTVTVDESNETCNNMDWTGVTHNPIFDGQTKTIYIHGSLTFAAGMSLANNPNISFEATTTGKTITTAGQQVYNFTLEGIGGGWTLQDALTITNYLFFNNGTFNTNSQTVTIGSDFGSSTGTTRSLILGSSVVNLNNWYVDGAPLTITPGTSTLNIASSFFGSGLNYYNISMTSGYQIYGNGNTIQNFTSGNNNWQGGNTVIGTATITGGSSFHGGSSFGTLTLNGTGSTYLFRGSSSYGTLNLNGVGSTYTLGAGQTQTITTALNITSGNCSALNTLNSSTPGTQATISLTSGTVIADYISLKDINAGTVSFTATDAIDQGDNTGWTITALASRNVYWIGNSGNWNDGNHWSLTSGGSPAGCPTTLLDNVHFDANSFSSTGQTVTVNVSTAACNNMDWTGVTHNPIFDGQTKTIYIHGSLTFAAGMSLANNPNISFEATTTGKTITTAGQQVYNFTLEGIGGGWTLQDALTITNYLFFNNGTFNTNSQTVTIGSDFGSSTGTTRSLILGSSVVNLNNWYVDGAPLTITPGTSTLNIASSFFGSGLNYYNISMTSGYQIYGNGNTIQNFTSGNNNWQGGNTVIGTATITGGSSFHGGSSFGTLTLNGTGSTYLFRGSSSYGTLNLNGVGSTYTLGAGQTQTITTALNITGATGASPIYLNSNSIGTQSTISWASGSLCTDYARITDINVTGGASFTAGPSSQNISDNSGWVFISGVPNPSVSITASTGTSTCLGTSVTFTAAYTNGGLSRTYQWFVNGISVQNTASNTYTTSSLTNGANVYAVISAYPSPCSFVLVENSNTLSMTISGSLTPAVGISASATSVTTGTSVTFTATPTNGGSSPAYQWTLGGTNITGANASTYSYIPSNGDQIACVLTSSSSCASTSTVTSSSLTMTVATILVPSSNASLSALTMTNGELSPAFDAGTISYTTTVSSAVSDITVTPTVADGAATVQVRINGGSYTSVTSGSASGSLTLNVGSNTVDVKITAQNGTIKTYSLSFTKSAASPTITSFSPISAAPGTSVTITGTNFNTAIGNNIVFFGATRATVTTATATQLTVTLPTSATYAPITELNTATSLACYSLSNFNPIYSPAKTSITSTDFATKVGFTTGNGPNVVAIGDLDGDGKPDLVIANSGDNTISVYRNIASSGGINSGSFASPVTFATGNTPYSVAIGDLDGDGKPDLAVTNFYGNTVSVLLNTSTIGSITSSSFATNVDFTTGNGPSSVAIGDLDGDGKPDLVTTNLLAGNLSIFLNTSTIGSITSSSFATPVNFAVGSYPNVVAIGDLDGDGKADLAVATNGRNSVSVFRNTSSIGSITSSSFAANVDFAIAGGAFSVAIGDLDGDGKLDLAAASQTGTVSVLRNTATSGSITAGSFDTHVDFTTGANPQLIAIGDLDGDGKPDLVVDNLDDGTVSILRNTSTSGSIISSSFAAKVDFASGANPQSIAIGDLDGDGKPDLVIANPPTNTFSVLRNTDLVFPPTITSFSPTSAVTGTSVTITGTNFNTTTGNNIVFFGATGATVTASTATSVTVTVPAGATYAAITILNTATGLAAYSVSNFTPVFSPVKTGISAYDFTAKLDFTAGASPYSVAIGDLDGDGKPDLVFANYSDGTVSILRNTSLSGNLNAGSFAAKVDFTTGAGPISVAIGDLDGDGKPDLVVSNDNSNSVSILHNTISNGSIDVNSFAAKVDFTTGSSPYTVAIADLDKDGRPDLAVTNGSDNSISILQNTTAANGVIDANSFAGKVDFITGTLPTSVVIGDLDGDGKPDLAVTNDFSNTLSVFRNTSAGGSISFAAKVDFATGANPMSVAIGDLDGDGKPDLAVANSGATTVSVYHNTATSGSIDAASFAAKVDFTTGTSAYSVGIGDLDGDGKPDLVVSNSNDNTVSVLHNTSTSGSIVSGSFAAKVDFATGAFPNSVAIGDLDGDGKPDLVLTNVNANSVSVLQSVYPLPPSITSFTPASGAIGTLVTITGTNLSIPSAFTIGGVSAIAISNDGTTLVGMVMPGATTGTVVVTAYGTATGASNFTVIASQAPNAQQGSKLTANDNSGNAGQGSSVAVSADGNTAIVGGINDNTDVGAAWVYIRSGGVWAQQGSKLTGNDNSGAANQGQSVSLSADGNTAIVGGSNDNSGIGAAWIYTRSGGTWTQQGTKLTGNDYAATAAQGYSVSLSADGNTAMVGGLNDGGSGAGAAWIYTRSGGVWTQYGNKLVGTGAVGGAWQGYSVSLSADGNTAIVGGPLDNSDHGAAWVFTLSGGTWTQQGSKLVGSDVVGNAQQGLSVALSADGNTAIFVGNQDNGGVGAAWVFTRSSSTWTQQGSKLVASGAQGRSVALSADGNTVIEGGNLDNSDVGAAWVWTRSGSTWTQSGSKLVGTGAIGNAQQGISIALSADGNTAMVGGYGDNSNQGASWVFIPSNTWTGTTNTDWATATNWSYGTVPVSSDAVIIPSVSNQPIIGISTTAALNNLTINSSATLTVNNILQIGGTISNSGTITATSGTITMNGSLAQSIPASTFSTNTIQNLIINNSAGVTLGGSLNITGTLTPTAGTLTTGGFLTLLSTISGSGIIAQGSTPYLSGNVNVQRYVGTSQQWRMIGFPFTAGTNIDEATLAGFYSSGYKAYTYNEAGDNGAYGSSGAVNAGWNAFTGGTITSNNGILLSGGVLSSTINFNGPINTGTQSIALSYTSANGNKGWNLIANPYASNIDWTTIIANNTSSLDNAIYRYDPNSTAYAAYVNAVHTGNQSNVIENGAGFFVHSTGITTLSISETDKTTSAPLASLFGVQPIGSQDKSIIKLFLVKQGEDYGDEVIVRWGVDPATDNFDGKYDAYDMGRTTGADLSVVGKDGTVYSIFHGSALQTKDKEQREVALGIKNITEGNYSINTNLLSAMYAGNDVFLRDHYTNQTTLISTDSASYAFMVTADALSSVSNRFSIALNYKAVDHNTANINLPVLLLNNPSTGNLFTLYSKNNFNQLQWEIVDASGRSLQTGLLSNVLKGSTHQINAGNTKQGNYFIKLNGDGNALPVLKALKN